MKHLKLYENKNTVWVYVNLSTTTPEVIDLEVLSDKKSAINYYIASVNEIAKDDQRYEVDDYDGEDLIFTYEDAKNYVEEKGYVIDIYHNMFINKFDLPEELIIKGSAKKYNI
jgi:hypothetical protein